MLKTRLGGRAGDSTRLTAAILLLAGLAGCSKSVPLDPVKSDGSVTALGSDAAPAGGFGSGTFYPLAIGNAWNYEGKLVVTVLGADGSPADGGFTIDYRDAHRITGSEVLEGVSYFVREEAHDELTEPPTVTLVSHSDMRQDATGLYVALTNPGAAAPVDLSRLQRRGFSQAAVERFEARVERVRNYARGIARSGVGPNAAGRSGALDELTWLRYPLHPGVEWNLLPGDVWPERVDRVEVLATGAGSIPAYRIETNPAGSLQPGEWVRLWYGRVGFLGYSVHIAGVATDENGNPTDQSAIFDEEMRLVSTTQRP